MLLTNSATVTKLTATANHLLGVDGDDAIHVSWHVPWQHDSNVCVNHLS